MKITQDKKQKKSVGRPTVDTEETRRKIEEAAALDASVEEIAFYANISRDTYYEIIKKDQVFSDRIEALRNRPILKARQTVVKSLDNPDHAFKYLERKKSKEFAQVQKLSGDPENPVEVLVKFINGKEDN